MKEKLKSRKFQVFLVWLVIAGISLFERDLPKETIFQYFGIISIVYIGGNVAQKCFASRGGDVVGKPEQ